jgi:4-nitrophenyl phosphatase
MKKFNNLGIPATVDQIFGSTFCAAFYIKNNLCLPEDKKVYICGMQGMADELEEMGIAWCGGPNDNQALTDMDNIGELELESDVGVVLAGFDIDINYKKIAKAYTYLKDPETIFLATNDDLTYPAGNIRN